MSSLGAFSSSCFNRDCFSKLQAERNSSMVRKFCIRGSVVSPPPQSLQFSDIKAQRSDKFRIGVLGASGYTGSEIVRLLANHPYFEITLMTADRKAGQPIGAVFPHLVTKDLPDMVAVKDADFSDVDAVFCCLPHGTTQEIIKGLPKGLKVVDLSADFRLRDIDKYEEWYGQPHRALDLQKEAVYGLTEIYRKEIQAARLVANPGCYPTSIQLPLVPLLKESLIEVRNIIIDSKSGVSGAGRGAKEANLYTEIAEGIHSYGITRHRHVPEIEQGLSNASNSRVTVSFTPHLMPMSRGMQSTIYVEMAHGVSTEDLYQHLSNSYKDEEFVVLLKNNEIPHTQHVRGSNYCLVNVFPDRIPGRAIIISVIDNLVKGASGQALQNLNLMMGIPENTGLLYIYNANDTSVRHRIEVLEALDASRQKEIFMLNARLATAESMTHDVIRDLLGLKLDMNSGATMLDNQQVQMLMEKAQLHHVQEVVKLKQQLNEFIKERKGWIEEIDRKQVEMVTAQVTVEKLRQRDQMLTTDNEMLKADNINYKKRVVELEAEIKKHCIIVQKLRKRIMLKSEKDELSVKLRRTEGLVLRVKQELAQYREGDGRSPCINFDEEQRLNNKLKGSDQQS